MMSLHEYSLYELSSFQIKDAFSKYNSIHTSYAYAAFPLAGGLASGTSPYIVFLARCVTARLTLLALSTGWIKPLRMSTTNTTSTIETSTITPRAK